MRTTRPTTFDAAMDGAEKTSRTERVKGAVLLGTAGESMQNGVECPHNPKVGGSNPSLSQERRNYESGGT
jgi:hypothetical protein